MYSNSYNSWRFSRLDQINTQNVKNLQVKWLFQGAQPGEVRDHAAGGGRHHVSHAAGERRVCARCRDRPRPVDLQPQESRAHLQLLRQGESRPRDPGQSPLHEHARHARHRHRRQVGPRVVEDRDVRLHRVRRIRRHRRAARREGQGDRRHGRRRAFHLRLSRCLRCRHRQALVALPHHSPARRAELRHLGRRLLEDRRRRHLEQRLLRSRDQHRLLGHQQSVAGLQRRFPRRRQSVLLLGAGARCGHRKAEVALPAHAARHARLGRHPDPDPAGCASSAAGHAS